MEREDIEEINQLDRQKAYGKMVEYFQTRVREEDYSMPIGARAMFMIGNAYHQLRDYNTSTRIMSFLIANWKADTEIGADARRMWAHGVLQRDGDIRRADAIMQEIPSSLGRENLRMNIFLESARKELIIPVGEVMAIISTALTSVPYVAVNGHIVSNGVLAIHIARGQQMAGVYLPILPGLIEAVVGIYERVGVAKNHLAGACGRASLIFESAGKGWYRGAEEFADDSVTLWEELRRGSGGESYQGKLEEALVQQAHMKELRARLKEEGS